MAALTGLAIALAGQAVATRPAAALEVGDRVPASAFRTEAGSDYDLRTQGAARLVLLSFVSPRCKPCQESRPALAQLSRDYGAEGLLDLVSVSLAVGPSSPPSEPTPPLFPETVLSADAEAAGAWGVYGTPVFFLVDRSGTVRWKHVGRLLPGVLEPTLSEVVAADRIAAVPSGG